MKKFCRLVDLGVIRLPLLNCALRNNSDGKFYVMSSLPQLKITIKTEIFTAVICMRVHWPHLSFLRRKQLSCIYPPAARRPRERKLRAMQSPGQRGPRPGMQTQQKLCHPELSPVWVTSPQEEGEKSCQRNGPFSEPELSCGSGWDGAL